MKRKYDIGDGWIMEDDGHVLGFSKKTGHSSRYFGILRPVATPNPEPGDTVDILYSLDRNYFYLPELVRRIGLGGGFWMGTRKWANEAEMKANTKPGIMGHSGINFTHTKTGEKWVREVLHFSFWSVKSEPQHVPHVFTPGDETSEMCLDYMSRISTIAEEEKVEADSRLKETGRTIEWIMERIGPWVPPTEIPVVVLS